MSAERVIPTTMQYSGKVLLVDDDQNVLELVKLYGEREGFKVIQPRGRKRTVFWDWKWEPMTTLPNLSAPGNW